MKASDGLKAAEFLAEIRQSDRVVQNPICAIIVGIGTPDDTDDGEILAVSTGDGVENAESADRERDDAGSNAARPGISVGRITRIDLITAADVVEARLGNEVIEKGEVEVSGDGEDVGDSDLDEAVGDVAAEGGIRGEGGGRRVRALD